RFQDDAKKKRDKEIIKKIENLACGIWTSNRCNNGRRRGRNDQPLFHYSQAEAYRALPACPIQMLRRMRASSREPCRHHPLRRVLEYSCLPLSFALPTTACIHLRRRGH